MGSAGPHHSRLKLGLCGHVPRVHDGRGSLRPLEALDARLAGPATTPTDRVRPAGPPGVHPRGDLLTLGLSQASKRYVCFLKPVLAVTRLAKLSLTGTQVRIGKQLAATTLSGTLVPHYPFRGCGRGNGKAKAGRCEWS